MAIGQRTATQDNKGTASTSHTVTKPAGLANGDVVYIALITNGTTVSAAPAGFTQIAAVTTQSNPKFYGYRKVMTDVAGEGAWTFTMGSATSGSICQAFTGVDTTTPEDTAVQTGTGATGSNTCTVTGVTTVTNGALLLYAFGVNSSTNALTAPAGMTQIAEGGARKHEMDYEDRPTAGATGNRAGAAASNTLAWAAWMVAIRPAVTAADNIATSKPELITAPSQRARRTRAVVWQPKPAKGVAAPPPPEITRPIPPVIGRRRLRRGSVTILRGANETTAAPSVSTRPALIVRAPALRARPVRLQPVLSRGLKAAPVVTAEMTRPLRIVTSARARRPNGKAIVVNGATRAESRTEPLTLVMGARPKRQTRQPWLGKATKDVAAGPSVRSQPTTLITARSRRRPTIQPEFAASIRQTAAAPSPRTMHAMLVLPASNPRRAQRVQPWLPDAEKMVDSSVHPIRVVTSRSRRRAVKQPYLPSAAEAVARALPALRIVSTPRVRRPVKQPTFTRRIITAPIAVTDRSRPALLVMPRQAPRRLQRLQPVRIGWPRELISGQFPDTGTWSEIIQIGSDWQTRVDLNGTWANETGLSASLGAPSRIGGRWSFGARLTGDWAEHT